jgi:hypothetical protein
MMTPELLDDAIDECKRFIEKAKAAKRRLKSNSLIEITGSMETGAARRASMDVSRMMSHLRKGLR